MKYTFNIVMYQDTCDLICDLICIKLGMRFNTPDLYSLIPLWITLVFTQGDRVTGKLELNFVEQLHVAIQIFVMLGCVRKMTVKTSCKFGVFGAFRAFALLLISVWQ